MPEDLSGVIGWEGKEPESRPKNYHPELDYRIKSKRMKGKNVTHSEFLAHMRSERHKVREVHSDGFLAISERAIECSCGGTCIKSDAYICPRCSRLNFPG